MEEERRVSDLIVLAQKAMSLADGFDLVAFVDATEAYLSTLEAWQAEVNARGTPLVASVDSEQEKESLRQRVKELQEIHQRLLSRAADTKEGVGVQMTELHKRATGMKKYVDTFPARITIAGKRKG